MTSPELTIGVFAPAGTCPGRLQRHCVIGWADPEQNPACRKVPQQSGSGEGPGQDNRAAGSLCRPGGGDGG